MAKISDSVVIPRWLLQQVIEELNDSYLCGLSSALNIESKELETIVKDTLIYCSVDDEAINNYINDKEI